MVVRFAAICLIAACSGAAQPAPVAPPPQPPTRSAPEQPQAPAMEPGVPCAKDGTCAGGFSCVKYYGIAGAKGPQFSSCEIQCDGKEGCPNGYTCKTIADGPGQVCRP